MHISYVLGSIWLGVTSLPIYLLPIFLSFQQSFYPLIPNHLQRCLECSITIGACNLLHIRTMHPSDKADWQSESTFPMICEIGNSFTSVTAHQTQWDASYFDAFEARDAIEGVEIPSLFTPSCSHNTAGMHFIIFTSWCMLRGKEVVSINHEFLHHQSR